MYKRKVFERYFKLDEERQLFRCIAQYQDIHARRDLAWMRLARHTGVRVCVLVGLTVLDAQQALRDGALHIRGAINKRNKEYSVPVNKVARAALKELLALRREMGHGNAEDTPLIMSRNHKGMSERSFQARMAYWCGVAKLPLDASPHWLRHTLAKRIMQQSTAQDPRAIVQQVLAHDDIETTMIYTLPDREDIARTMDEVA